ncbi:MAG TPA: arylamine N-acetyltransferase, partial [Rhizobacter sp.]
MIDLDAYLHRLAYTGPRHASLAVLRELCARHPARIPYENIDPLLGTPPSLEPAAVHAKLVDAGRGGYCFEQNLLLQRALQSLGFEVSALAARVVWMRPPEAPARPRSHMLLKVSVPDGAQARDYIADAGFGGNL